MLSFQLLNRNIYLTEAKLVFSFNNLLYNIYRIKDDISSNKKLKYHLFTSCFLRLFRLNRLVFLFLKSSECLFFLSNKSSNAERYFH